MPSRRANKSPCSENGRGLSHVTHTIFGSTVGYPSDSLASCSVVFYIGLMKIMFYIRCYPNETTMVMNCNADAMNVAVGYSYVQRCQTQFYIHSYVNISL